MRCHTVGTVAAPDPEQIGGIEGFRLRREGTPYPLGTPNENPASLSDRGSKSTGLTDGLLKKVKEHRLWGLELADSWRDIFR